MTRPVVGVALGAGGARGFAHIGVLKAFEEHGVPVDIVAGSSMGGLVGALYATGSKPRFMEEFASHMRRRYWVDLSVPKMGILTGEKVRHLVHLMTRGLRLDQTNIPLAITATDLLSRKNVVFYHECIADAVRASISIPGVFVPYRWNGGLYVDGGVLDPVPVDAALSLGATVVVAVDVSSKTTQNHPSSMMDVVLQAFEIMQERVNALSDVRAQVEIRPPLDGVGISQFHRADEAVAAGYEAAMAAINEVKQII